MRAARRPEYKEEAVFGDQFGYTYFMQRYAELLQAAEQERLARCLLQARRAEKDFQLRRNESYIKRHSELSAGIDRDLEKLKSLARSSGVRSAGCGFA